MKIIRTLAIVIAISIVSCKSHDKSSKKIESKSSTAERKISRRNYSINNQNSYNDIFLDSNDVENFIHTNTVPDSIANFIRSFYNTRNYQFAWFSSNGLTEQAYGFWSLQNYSGDTSNKIKSLEKTMDDLMSDDSLMVNNHDASFINTELLLTGNFIHFARNNFEKGYVTRKEMERFVPFKKEDPLSVADSLINKKHKDNKYFSEINISYKLLSDELKKYLDIARGGGWPAIPGDAVKLKKGVTSLSVINIKKFLTVTGDLARPDSTGLYNDTLVNAVKNFQSRFGYTPDGILSASLIKQMNVPVTDRIRQILINMNRMRWMPQEPAGQLIVVNIPEFYLYVYDGKNKVFNMIVVVGKEGHNTTIFSDKLTTIVFSPYWNIPSSIVKKEIIPGIARNKKYLKKHNMEIYGKINGLPAVRQKPGGDNSLGKVKFLFPNTFNIYFHDTPSKGLFSKDVRAYSHGCIRLKEPEKLADYLLSDNSQWTKEKINEAMNSEHEQYVAVKHPVPVFITYYTAWVDENGKLNFRNDIYGHDKEIAGKMFK